MELLEISYEDRYPEYNNPHPNPLFETHSYPICQSRPFLGFPEAPDGK